MRIQTFVIVTGLLVTGAAQAATWDKGTGIGINGSAVKFIGDQTDRAAVGNSFGLSLRYGVSPYVQFDLNAGYGSFKPAVHGSKIKKDELAPYRTFIFPAQLNLRATPVKEGRIKPYLFVGAGVLLWDLRNVGGTDQSFWGDHELRWGNRISGLTTQAVLSEGLGLEFFLSKAIALDLQGRFSTLLEVDKDNVGYVDYNDQIVEARATLTFYFGHWSDIDKDGIEDKVDAAPEQAEDFDGFQDQDGAPDLDNDRDGVPDQIDQAPLTPEDQDGYMDEDGVPDPDNDGDGINDEKDQCPDDAEDLDGFDDTDGCPDEDNDGDGIPDLKDRCPNDPETKNDFEDQDGCPDVKPMRQLEQKGAKLILKGVNFESGSASLTEKSYSVLDEVIDGLMEHKEVEIEIRGYTDSVGKERANQILSERRAQSVVQYLVNAGIDPDRLRAVGYGEKNPIASNGTAVGRAQNRRIEFVRSK